MATLGRVPPARAKITQLSPQSMVNANTTAITWDTADVQVGGVFWTVANATRIVIPQAGWYDYKASATHTDVAGTGTIRYLYLRLNGGSVYPSHDFKNPPAATVSSYLIADSLLLAKDDYLELAVFQDSGGNKNTVANNGAACASFSIAKAP